MFLRGGFGRTSGGLGTSVVKPGDSGGGDTTPERSPPPTGGSGGRAPYGGTGGGAGGGSGTGPPDGGGSGGGGFGGGPPGGGGGGPGRGSGGGGPSGPSGGGYPGPSGSGGPPGGGGGGHPPGRPPGPPPPPPPGGGGAIGLPAVDPDWMIRCTQVMSTLMDRSQDLANGIRQIAAHRPVTEGRYQAALKTLMFFSGQHASDKRGICPEATHNIESSCDKWISRYELFTRTHNLGDEYDRRAFFERLTGQAINYMKEYQPSIITVYELIQILRLRFQRPRTWDDVNAELNSFERKRFEDIAS